MYTVTDWLAFHEVERHDVEDIIAGLRAGALRALPPLGQAEVVSNAAPELRNQQNVFAQIIKPAFQRAFADCSSVTEALCHIEFRDTEDTNELPHAVDNGNATAPSVVINWRADAESLLILAHEVAHAIQIILSRGSQMPPLAREVCAFTGELALLAHVNRSGHTDLFERLCTAWEAQNSGYLGSDLETLEAALQAEQAAYHYRHNYPIARLVACELFVKGRDPWLAELFASGKDAMSRLPIAQMANAAGSRANYLPALPMCSTDQPALGAYRSLGAMALLEIEYWNGVSEAPLGDVYQGLLQHMQKQTAFIALDRHHRPLGYATWEQAPESNRITLTRQAAPFGDHLELQKSLSKHLQHDAGVASRNSRSARPEQEAW